MLTALSAGVGLGLSLIVAIGAQNLFVLRQGIRREHAIAVATVCAVSDALLIALGVSGLGFALQAAPWLIDAVRWAGAAFLTVYAVLAARRALRPTAGLDADEPAIEVIGAEQLDQDAAPRAGTRTASPGAAAGTATATPTRLAPVLLACLALTWLNPHVYLDTVFLLGSVASTHGDDRWWFAAGAMAASVLWFFSLALGARYLGRWLRSPRAWRVLDGAIAVVMLAIAVSLVVPHA
ncbi:MAG TPA: LysE/ArgO family amino acid transporter [Microbacterium sp.]|nr:LysE/ArgO family amino acid transporter [Microbacterium sp.]